MAEAARPFRFGVNARDARSRAEWADKARRAEDLGYWSFTVPDHLSAMLAPVPALMSAASATAQIRVGTNVLNNDFRHPVLVAREAATADLLTDGRLQLGMGAGHIAAEYAETGMAFDRGALRVERLAEAVGIVKRLLEGEAVTADGRFYRISGHRVHPRPVQRPHPPILIGGNGPRLLALAAREADVVGLSGITFRRGGTEPDLSAWRDEAVDERIRLIRAAAGERFPRLVLSALLQAVIATDDRRRAGEELARRFPPLTASEVLASPFASVGTVDEQVEELLTRRARWGISYYVVFEQHMQAFAPVVARLAGR